MADFFIASDEDLNNLDCRPPAEMPAGEVDGEVDLLMLCNLESILTGVEWESVFDKFYINPVMEHGPDGPWIYQVSARLLDALRSLSPESLIDCANQWAETDEWTLRDNTPLEKIADVIRGLIGLSHKAQAEGKRLFILTDP